MTPRERAIAALTLKTPDKVPTFELEFQISNEMFGIDIYPGELYSKKIYNFSPAEREKKLTKLAEDMVYVYDQLDYSIIPGLFGIGSGDWADINKINPELKFLIKKLNELTKGQRMLGYHADGTFSIPDGDQMYDFAYRMVDDPAGLHEQARQWMEEAIERNKALADAGIEVGLLCSDYCYNSGPFLSPAQFEEFIQPYLAKIIQAGKKEGMYMIKHTDGDIMPILNQLVDCEPHGLHSIDPMAGVDIKLVKELVGHRICLCGNVHCAAMQTGTDEEVIASAEYCMIHGKHGGGYIFCTSNCAFRGMPVRRYEMALDVWRRMRDY